MHRSDADTGAPPDETTRLETEWSDLAERMGSSPFARPGWVRAWARSRSVAIDPVVVRRNGDLAGILPVVRAPESLVTPTDWHTPMFEAVAADDAAMEELAAAVAGLHRRHVRLGFVDQAGPTFRAFERVLGRAGYRLRTRTKLESPYITLDGDWDSYLAAWTSKHRSDLRRRRRRLEEAGEVRLEVHDGRDGLDRLLDEGFEVEASGWKGTEGTAILCEGTEELYREAAAWAAGGGSLRLGFLRLDGKAIAFDYSFQLGNVHYLAKTGIRPDFGAFAPGKLLRAFMIERAFDDGLDTYDFVGDADPWKLEWTQKTRTIVTLDAFSHGPAGHVAEAADLVERAAQAAGRRFRRWTHSTSCRFGR